MPTVPGTGARPDALQGVRMMSGDASPERSALADGTALSSLQVALHIERTWNQLPWFTDIARLQRDLSSLIDIARLRELPSFSELPWFIDIARLQRQLSSFADIARLRELPSFSELPLLSHIAGLQRDLSGRLEALLGPWQSSFRQFFAAPGYVHSVFASVAARLSTWASWLETEGEERLEAALACGSDEELCEFLEWYYGGAWRYWPATERAAWLLQVVAEKEDEPLERVVKRVYAEALRRLASVDWETVPVMLVREDGTEERRDDLRAEALAAWGRRLLRVAKLLAEGAGYVAVELQWDPSLRIREEDGRYRAVTAGHGRIGDFLPVVRMAELRRGRPRRFESRAEFLAAVGFAAREVCAEGKYPSVAAVAERLSKKRLISEVDPERSLHYYRVQFGFDNWREVLEAVFVI